MRIFRDRHDAGAQLARTLQHYTEAADTVVLAHSRASVPVAYEIATRLALPLDLADIGDAYSDACTDPLYPQIDVRDRVVLLVDDGERARELPLMIDQLREHSASSVIAVVAVASPQVHAIVHATADHLVCGLTPQHLFSIEAWYADREPPSDDDVRQLLASAARSLLLARHSNFLGASVDT